MASGNARTVYGSFVGDASARNVRTIGFRPTSVRLENIDGLARGYWQESMADDSMVLIITAGTMTFETSDGIIPLADGFTFGANADLNAADEIVHWAASD